MYGSSLKCCPDFLWTNWRNKRFQVNWSLAKVFNLGRLEHRAKDLITKPLIQTKSRRSHSVIVTQRVLRVMCSCVYHVMNTYRRVERILKLGTKWRKVISFTLWQMNTCRKIPRTRLIRHWGICRVGLGVVNKRRNVRNWNELKIYRSA